MYAIVTCTIFTSRNTTGLTESISIHSLSSWTCADSILNNRVFVLANGTLHVLCLFAGSTAGNITWFTHSCFFVGSFIFVFTDTESVLIDGSTGGILTLNTLVGVLIDDLTSWVFCGSYVIFKILLYLVGIEV